MSSKLTYYVWAVLVTDGYTEQIVRRLVRRNWDVGSLGNTLSLRNEDNLATMLAFSMSKAPKSDKPEDEVTLPRHSRKSKTSSNALASSTTPSPSSAACPGAPGASATSRKQRSKKKHKKSERS